SFPFSHSFSPLSLVGRAIASESGGCGFKPQWWGCQACCLLQHSTWSLEADQAILQRMKKLVKAIHSSGLSHTENEEQYIEALEQFGSHHLAQNKNELSTGFLNLAVFTREVTALFKNLWLWVSVSLCDGLPSLSPCCLPSAKIEKEKKDRAKQLGLTRAELSPAEVTDDVEKERRIFQLHMCEYLLKVNEIKVREGPDLLQSLIKYFHAQQNFFQDGLKAAESLSPFVEKLATTVHTLKQCQDEESKQLTQTRDSLRAALQVEQKEDSLNRKNSGYSIHPLPGNRLYGTEKSGFLNKKSDGIRRVWQKRKCGVKYGYLTISHSTINRPPAKLNLLTCQVRPSPEERRCFDLIAHNRTYHFQAEDEQECQVWVSVLQNSKDEALSNAFKGDLSNGCSDTVQELTKAVIAEVKAMAGNDLCCDCGAPDPTWLSTNLGILTCIECSGIHREMGVHHSRIQSLTLDVLSTSELLVSSSGLASLFPPRSKSSLSACRNARKEYITAKYMERRYVRRGLCEGGARLYDALRNKELMTLVQMYSERVDLSAPLILPDGQVREGERAGDWGWGWGEWSGWGREQGGRSRGKGAGRGSVSDGEMGGFVVVSSWMFFAEEKRDRSHLFPGFPGSRRDGAARVRSHG
uniref:ArfGAP with SH3 domain, ankyrin repeat and PH domain 3 n=1 Tax=Callorhinchus milii TaxID=7868 RepID=A0A4W3JFX2_CALMI